jgi:hypothetical protein
MCLVILMRNIPNHISPNYSEESREDALFHYTTASGLLGIFQNNELWSTAYYCTNDEMELSSGRDVLTPVFRTKTQQMIQEKEPRVDIFRSRGVDIQEYANKFEQHIVSFALHVLSVYITCFCIPRSKEDFLHGLLSQWRGYGVDGGYALQFSRKRLQERIDRMNKAHDLCYELQDVHYSPDNPLKDDVITHSEAFISAYLEHLEMLENLQFNSEQVRNPISGLSGGPLESLLDFLIHTKSGHFDEEKECRMSVLEPASSGLGVLPADYFNRNGLIVPYTRTPPDFNVLDCIDWVIVGPSSKLESRFNSVSQMVKKMGLNIKVRPSHIPFSRA